MEYYIMVLCLTTKIHLIQTYAVFFFFLDLINFTIRYNKFTIYTVSLGKKVS